MWCLVSQPNSSKNALSSMVIEVRVGNKATGQECLNQVCQKLGIIESDYFGLQFKGARNEELWLNLRNEIRQEISAPLRPTSDGLKIPAIRFQLRVKFWVPPHLLLQESTRHQFFLHARVELLEGHLVVKDLESAVRVCALATQAELGDATGITTQTEFYLNCLPGLQFGCQGCIQSHNASNQPSNSPSRRNGNRQFYFHSNPTDTIHNSKGRASFLPLDMKKEEWVIQVHQYHQTLKGMPASVAEYWMLKDVSMFNGYGTETFYARWIGGPSSICSVAVSPQGVAICSLENDRRLSIPFSSIEVATNNNARFLLKYISDTGEADSVALKLETYQASVSLYRAITEKHAFYSCETVRSAVTSQFVRDLKGTIASFFNENTDLGKKYVFDIQRTCREVYDNARRILYQNGGAHLAVLPVPGPPNPNTADSTPCSDPSCKAVREHLGRIQEALLCRICMDNDIEVAFCPCGHSLACLPCAQRCDQCPVCRASVSHTQTIFLPLVGIERRNDENKRRHFGEKMVDVKLTKLQEASTA